MSGKKFVIVFSAITFVVGIIFLVAMKHSYDTRPQIPQKQQEQEGANAPSSENK